MIQVEGLRVRYPNQNNDALRGMDMTIHPGERILISGPTGCGKSTLGYVLCGAIPSLISAEMSGTVLLNRNPLAMLSVRDIAQQLGFLLQNVEHQIFTDRVDEEIAFGLENFAVPGIEIPKRIQQSLALTHAGHLARRWISTLSAGERQRVMLASLLALDQNVLVLDEPLAFLDCYAQREFGKLITGLARSGKTILIFEHRRDLIKASVDREIWMDNGCCAPYPVQTEPFLFVNSAPAADPLLEVENISFCWPGSEKILFSGVSLQVRPGESVVLLGENGCGKTTLLLMAMGFFKPETGQITNCGKKVGSVRPSQIAEQVGFLFQNPDHQLYLATVSEEVRMQIRYPEKADMELSDLGLADLRDRHPRSLSMGQKRRLTLAAALARCPKLMLLDEPSVGQDDKSLNMMIRRLGRFVHEGGALLTATHDERVAQALAHRIILLENCTAREVVRAEVRRFFGKQTSQDNLEISDIHAQEALKLYEKSNVFRASADLEGSMNTRTYPAHLLSLKRSSVS